MQKFKKQSVIHENKDWEMFPAWLDSAFKDLTVLWLIKSLSSILDFKIPTAHVKGPKMQSELIYRYIHVLQPKQICARQKWFKNCYVFEIEQ